MSILLTNIQKWLDERQVISNISLEVNDGELFVLLGGSGSGKSTLLRIIAGLVPADEGKIVIAGRDVTNLPPQDRDIGFVFQNYSVFRHMTVLQNIEFGLKIQGVPAGERQQRSIELMDLVNLSGLGSRYANQLSGGQQQRVALARALAYNPKVLLLDEPFGALDVMIRAQLRKNMKAIQRQLQMTTILVTHDQEEAFELADRIGVIDYGQLLEVGSPESLYHYPQKEFTATFIGGGNVLIGRKEGDQIRLGKTSLRVPKDIPFHDERVPVRILFRPETVQLQETAFTSDQAVQVLGRGIVKGLTFSGSLQRIHLEVNELQGVQPLMPRPVYGERTTSILAIKPSTADKQYHFKPGQQLWIGLRDYHILNPTGLKIMIYADEAERENVAAGFGLFLGSRTGGSVTLLSVVDRSEHFADARQRLEEISHPWRSRLIDLTIKVEQGHLANEIINEAFREHYEVCVLNKQMERLKRTKIWQQLVNSGMPVLLVQQAHSQIKQVLICIAAGEPGKNDILFGGRVAKLTRAHVTILHVAGQQVVNNQQERIIRYLKMGKASLDALGVTNEIKLEISDDLVKTITSETSKGHYDLLVIGGPAPKIEKRLIWSDKTLQIISRTSCPVLVVPMTEG